MTYLVAQILIAHQKLQQKSNSIYISSFSQKNNNKFIGIARAGNVIGGGDWSENRLIPDCIKSCVKNKKVLIRNPNSTRPLKCFRGSLWLLNFSK